MNRFVRRSILFVLSAVLMTTVLGAKAHAQDRHVKIVNYSSSSVFHLYISSSARTVWDDMLGDDEILRPNHFVTYNVDNGSTECYYDFKAILSDGRKVTHMYMNVCNVSEWDIYDSD